MKFNRQVCQTCLRPLLTLTIAEELDNLYWILSFNLEFGVPGAFLDSHLNRKPRLSLASDSDKDVEPPAKLAYAICEHIFSSTLDASSCQKKR